MLVEAILPSTAASIVLLDCATGRLRQGAAPNLPADYTAAIQDLLREVLASRAAAG